MPESLFAGAGPHPCLIREDGRLDDDATAGVRMGLAEAARTAQLLGTTVAFANGNEPANQPCGVIQGSAASIKNDVAAIARIALQRPVGPARGCVYWIGMPDADRPRVLNQWLASQKGAVLHENLRIEDWHPSLKRYGALELNERFVRATGRPMSASAWRGWFAVKTLAETLLRQQDDRDACAALSAATFDGHKGQPLSFDVTSKGLRHPMYIVRQTATGDEVIAEVV